ncbi:MAG: LON peptidase substrate-binding domain-containing protein [Myxococcota bacterium]
MSEGERLAIFPLSNVVLFPRLSTPLHLFEPRYRQMAREVLEGDQRIGMVVVRPEHTDEMGGDPPVYPIGCAGTVTESQRLPTGQYDIVLRGEARFRIVEEEPREEPRLYRVARVVPLEDAYPESERERVARLRSSIIENVGVLLRNTQPERARGLGSEMFAGVDDETLVNLLSNALALPVEEKQSLLEADSIPERYARLAGVLSFQRADLEVEDPSRGGPLH